MKKLKIFKNSINLFSHITILNEVTCTYAHLNPFTQMGICKLKKIDINLVFSTFVIFLLLCFPAYGAIIYVDNNTNGCATIDSNYNPTTRSCPYGSSTVYNTIDGAVDAANRGDTIYVRAGTYKETITPSASGTQESDRITIESYGSEIVIVSGTQQHVKLFGDYYTIKGLVFDGSSYTYGIQIIGGADHNTLDGNEIKNFTSTYTLYGDPNKDDIEYLWLKNNTVHDCSNHGFIISGNNGTTARHILIERNTFYAMCSRGNYDAIGVGTGDGGCEYVVVRNNIVFNNPNCDSSIDMGGHHDYAAGGSIPARYYLAEGNVIHTNPSYFKFHGDSISNSILRYNEMTDEQMHFYNLPNTTCIYNNTVNTKGKNGGIWWYIDQAGDCGNSYKGQIFKNNIIVNAGNNMLRIQPAGTCTTNGNRLNTTVYNESTEIGSMLLNGNIYNFGTSDILWVLPDPNQTVKAYDTGANIMAEWANWKSDSGQEKNGFFTTQSMDQLFVDEPVGNYNPATGSDLIDSGISLTNVHADDPGYGTSLIVINADYFQDGWGMSGIGVEADWIAVGNTSNAVQISSIDYSTNTIRLVNSISRNHGDNVWLYKKSDGKQVLYGSKPDVGAREYAQNAPQPAPLAAPTNLRISTVP
jgi:hypothetical protein